jgi:hypothetical protein
VPKSGTIQLRGINEGSRDSPVRSAPHLWPLDGTGGPWAYPCAPHPPLPAAHDRAGPGREHAPRTTRPTQPASNPRVHSYSANSFRNGIEDVHSHCGRELCALARVSMNSPRRTGPVNEDCPVPCSPVHPRAAPGPRETLAGSAALILGDPQAGSRPEHQGPGPGMFLARSAGLCGMLPRPACLAFQRRSLWLDQASARGALAVASRGSSDGSATAATWFRCCPGPCVRSRRLPGAAA